MIVYVEGDVTVKENYTMKITTFNPSIITKDRQLFLYTLLCTLTRLQTISGQEGVHPIEDRAVCRDSKTRVADRQYVVHTN